MNWKNLPAAEIDLLRAGTVIPAHPLALNADRSFDSRHQRALTRYYLDAGVGGLAVGVHGTQFQIREHGLYKTVLENAANTSREWVDRPVFLIAGLIGKTAQAESEAALAVSLGYHAGMLSLSAMAGASIDELIEHCKTVAKAIPLIGFYLQESVGGIALPLEFWQRFAQIDNVIAIKAAPFNRYATLDVVRGVVAAHAEARVTLYTGNDDHIVLDLLAPYKVMRGSTLVNVQFRGGLLGHWSVWTRSAVALLKRIQHEQQNKQLSFELLAEDSRVTDCNSAVFDTRNNFAGVIPGCNEVLRRQGLLQGNWCLDPNETLSAGQANEITRVSREHVDLTDDDFVAENLSRWLES